MFRCLLYTLLCLCTVKPSIGQLTNGLVAHWNFNGNANDATGNGYTGTPFNISYTTGKAGMANTAAIFNGSSSYVHVPHQADLNLTNYTICAMVKPMGFYQGTCQGNFIMFRGSEGVSGAYGMGYFDNAYNDCSTLDTSKHVFYAQAGSSSGNFSSFQSTIKVHTNTWYCVCAVYNGNSIKIYVNSILTATFNITSGNIGSSTDPIGIGKYLNRGATFPYWYNGVIDDLRLYNRALSQLEIDSFCNIFNSSATEQEVSISQPVNPTSFCPADKFILHYTVTAPFNTGNIFIAQLSDAGGSFATPVVIGSVAATGAGTINCTIPANTPPGTGYRVRVAASDPLKNSIDNGVNLTVFESSQIIINNRNIVTCVDYPLTLSAQVSPANTTIIWSGPMGFSHTGNNALIPRITPEHTGNYTITANYNGCVTSDSIKVSIGDPYFILGNDTTLCESKTLELNALSLPGSTYLWQDGSTGPSFTVTEQGLYHVTATNICGTFGSNIQVDYIPCECNPIIPNAFTPNQDGLNDAINPILDCIPAKYKFLIANRWGQIVFETEDYQKKWDGRHITTPAPLGTYFYYLQITDKLGNKIMHKGDIVLLR